MLPEVERTLCRVLAGIVHPRALSPGQLNEVWAHALETSGGEVLADVLVAAGDQIGGAARERALAFLRAAAVTAMLRQRVLHRVVDAFAVAETRMLLIKGVGLAYTVYPEPNLRPAGDIDLFIARESLEAAEAALASAGFARDLEPDTESASMQRHYIRREDDRTAYVVDLHWRISNRQIFAGALPFDEAWHASQPVRRLGRAARTLGTADALLLACIHRIAHHHDDPHLIWLWDIHLLAGAMTSMDVEGLAARAARRDMRAVVARGFELSRERFGTAVDQRLLLELHRSGAAEASADFVGRRTRQVELVLSDLATMATLSERARLLREHLFPSLAYMGGKYPAWPRLLLPLAYLYRMACGAPKWFRRES
jgi:hypothetical protein